MSYYTLELFDELPKDAEEKMSRDLVAYERSNGIELNFRELSIVARDESDEPIGVLKAYTVYAEVYIDDLWVHGDRRKQGIGTRLVQELEGLFANKGLNNINLVTSAFQAPGFYRKLGYTEEFTRVNRSNPELSKTFFVKFFDHPRRDRGQAIQRDET